MHGDAVVGGLRTPYIFEGDCLKVMAGFPDCSVDAVVCDPPYDLLTSSRNGSRRINNPDTPAGRSARGFMGKTWDGTGVAFRVETWAEVFRVAKPGAHLLAFGGTRTYHRLVCAIEDAGWEIRDCLVWAYASGFPKSLNFPDGWGTALKPAWEPIVMARKPLRGTVAQNRERYGPGALNIDGTRLPSPEPVIIKAHDGKDPLGNIAGISRAGDAYTVHENTAGRWPANLILTDPIFDGDTPGVVGGGRTVDAGVPTDERGTGGIWELGDGHGKPVGPQYGDSGTYSRFFLIPKADRAEREPFGLDDFEARREQAHRKTGPMDTPYLRGETMRRNTHPTVKPVELMRHLIRLVTPSQGTVLDPFLGSGTTAIAAEMEGVNWIGIEKEPEYVAIAKARLLGTQRGLGLLTEAG